MNRFGKQQMRAQKLMVSREFPFQRDMFFQSSEAGHIYINGPKNQALQKHPRMVRGDEELNGMWSTGQSFLSLFHVVFVC